MNNIILSRKNIIILSVCFITTLIIIYIYLDKYSYQYVVDDSDNIKLENLIDVSISGNEMVVLSNQEKSDLIYIREEEKLARDVYMELYERWGLNIFSNISRSEQTHTDSVADLMDLYKVPDVVDNNEERGVFENPELQVLYTSLVAKGKKSLLDALKVGAMIEDLDIVDLESAISNTNNIDIITLYRNLQKGSRNHLRAFNKQINNKGDEYNPVYLTEKEFNSIIETKQEKGVYSLR